MKTPTAVAYIPDRRDPDRYYETARVPIVGIAAVAVCFMAGHICARFLLWGTCRTFVGLSLFFVGWQVRLFMNPLVLVLTNSKVRIGSKDGPLRSCRISDVRIPKDGLQLGLVIFILGMAAACLFAFGFCESLRESWSFGLSREAFYSMQFAGVVLLSAAISLLWIDVPRRKLLFPDEGGRLRAIYLNSRRQRDQIIRSRAAQTLNEAMYRVGLEPRPMAESKSQERTAPTEAGQPHGTSQ